MHQANPDAEESSDRLEMLFAAAIELPDGEQRALFLGQLAPEDAPMRAQLESLLEAHGRGQEEEFLEAAPATVRLAASEKMPSAPGDRIGAYRLTRILGRGGMGTVFLASQVEPVRREVAIKILTTAELAPEALAHFQIERHALCRLEHPNISQLFDAGSLPDGTPYFVMDRVDGEPIDGYFENHAAPLNSRVRILAEICETLHYAHGRGVLHRDLKPSNILVTEADGTTRIRVIDFGVAYLEGESHPNGITGGTPGYMSPEQEAGEHADVAAEVFSIGMIGCNVLGNWSPDDGRESIAAHLEKLPQDLAAILSKATTNAPVDRYTSAENLARDLRRFIDLQPVMARRQTAGYIVRRFVQRHPVPMFLTAALVIALATTAVQIWQSNSDLAAALKRERELRAESELMADYCRKLLRTPDALSLQRGAKVRDLLAAAVVDAAQHFADRPVLHADILTTLADSYAKLGYLAESRDLYRKVVKLHTSSLGTAAPQTIEALLEMGRLQLALGQTQETRRLAEVALIRIDRARLDSRLRASGKLLLARALVSLGMPDAAQVQLQQASSACEDPTTRWIAQMELLGAEPGTPEGFADRITMLLEQQPTHDDSAQDGIHRAKLRLVDTLVNLGMTEQARRLLRHIADSAAGPAPRLGAELRLALLPPLDSEALGCVAERCATELGHDHLLAIIARVKQQGDQDTLEQLTTFLGSTHPLVCSVIIERAEALAETDANAKASIALLSKYLSDHAEEIAATAPNPDIVRIRFELATLLAADGNPGNRHAAQLILSKALGECDALRDRQRFPDAHALLTVDARQWTPEMRQRLLLSRIALFRSWGHRPSSPPPSPYEPLLPLAGRF
ncbi:MAG: tetratricopeptide (TPR) repeat protein [Verrucomicrobiales bacterium]|jgi:tetratricopeptide (TPR) repeat protein